MGFGGDGHGGLGMALAMKGNYAEAVVVLREAERIAPVAHGGWLQWSLGTALRKLGDLQEASEAFRRAIRHRPSEPQFHAELAEVLTERGDHGAAIAAYREAIRLKPDYAEAHCNLGHTLRGVGDFAGSLAELRRGHELGSKRPDWPHPSAEWVRQAERLAALVDRLPAVLKGDDSPRDAAERLAFAQMARDTGRYAAASRLWAEALESDPALAEDRQAQYRYLAACSSALAAAGKGEDGPKPDDAARAEWRHRALGWLKAERAAWAQVLDSGDAQARPILQQVLQHWRADPDLAGVRDGDGLAKLPEVQRAAWRALWADVEALLARARGGRP
jgi:tetratricopeptide (TPR) repeat protein